VHVEAEAIQVEYSATQGLIAITSCHRHVSKTQPHHQVLCILSNQNLASWVVHVEILLVVQIAPRDCYVVQMVNVSLVDRVH